MTVKELITELERYNLEAEVDIVDHFKPDCDQIAIGIESLRFGGSDNCTIKNCKKVYIFGMTFEELVIRYCSIPRIVNKYKEKYGTYNR